MQMVREAYGRRTMVLYQCATVIFFASAAIFNTVGFIDPPWGEELIMSAAIILINGAALVVLAAIAIPRGGPGATVKRISMWVTLLGSWVEVATDCASGAHCCNAMYFRAPRLHRIHCRPV